MGESISQLPWVNDGIVERERQLLEELATLTSEYPKLAERVMEYSWIKTVSGRIYPEHRGVAAIRSAARIDLALAKFMADYDWVQNGVSASEANTLDAIAELASHHLGMAEMLSSTPGFVNGDSPA